MYCIIALKVRISLKDELKRNKMKKTLYHLKKIPNFGN